MTLNPIAYPRRRFVRHSLRMVGRLGLPLLAKVQITGKENFPESGPLIVVGNHTAAMEVVLMTLYSPWLIEYLGSTDIPHEPYIAAFINAYGMIAVHRGAVSRSAMRAALGILHQGGVLGLFPEGGIWEPTIQRAQTGVAWLSYHAQAPILPIGFGSMRGTLHEMFRLQHPSMQMHVGRPLPPVTLSSTMPRKAALEEAAMQVMDAIWKLVPEEDRPQKSDIEQEQFAFHIHALDSHGENRSIPHELAMLHGAALSKFIHRATLFSNLRDNLQLPIQPLRELHTHPSTQSIQEAASAIVNYLRDENPYYFTYRYGPKEGYAMGEGARELLQLSNWALARQLQLRAKAIRSYQRAGSDTIIIEDKPEETDKW